MSERKSMSADTTRYLDLLEQRIVLLGSLADALVSAGASISAFDIDGLEARIATQQQLCAEISALDSRIDAVQRHCAEQAAWPRANDIRLTGAAEDSPLRQTLERLQAVQSSVKQLNEAHKILLRRSRRTVGALLNSYHTFAMTYADPAAPRAAIGEMV
jgi:small-conductance mechanosensitive channel